MLKQISEQIKKIILTDITEIIKSTRKNMVVVIEKSDGDSATIADLKISELLKSKLKEILPDSLYIEEETFNEEIYNEIEKYDYIWVVDPIDGTKAFRDINNGEYCVGVALMHKLRPVLSFIYAPEYELNGVKGYLLEWNKEDGKVYFNGDILESYKGDITYCSHIHKDTTRSDVENLICEAFPYNETIRAHAGHSTLVRYSLVACNLNNYVFSRRDTNLWDVVPSACFIKELGGDVYYKNGESIFPIDLKKLKYDSNHLVMPFNIASSEENKKIIVDKLNINIKHR